MSVFETATRKKYRFSSVKGEISTEQLWDVPLSSKDSFDLENIGQTILAGLSTSTTTSLVKINPDPQKAAKIAELEGKLEVVKHVISVKVAEMEAAQKKAANKVERDKLLDALARKEDADLEGMSQEAIRKRLAELDG
jgi:hypothetical protein